MKPRRAIRVVAIVGALVMFSFSTLVMVPERASAYIPHAPIYIDGNVNFTAANGMTGGSGTPSDPYTIEGWEIDTSTADGITITNTNSHFVIRNVYAHHEAMGHDGIEFYNVSNGRVENSTLVNNYYGLYLQRIHNITVKGNMVSQNEVYGIFLRESINSTVEDNIVSGHHADGIYLSESSNDTIENNTVFSNSLGIVLSSFSWGSSITNNTVYSNSGVGIHLPRFGSSDIVIAYNNVSNNGAGIGIEVTNKIALVNNTISNNSYGISLEFTMNSTLMNNLMFENGILIDAYYLRYWNTHEIDTSNTINGKPVYYWKNVTGGTVPPDAGEVILANCTGVTVENMTFRNSSVGILLGFSSNNTITNNTVENILDGIRLSYSNNNTVSNNTLLSNSRYGIYVVASGNRMTNNTIMNNSEGVYLWGASGNTVANNIISNGSNGIYVYYGNHVIANNTISNTTRGIYLESSGYNTITNNVMVDTGIHIMGWSEDWNTNMVDPSNTVNGKPVYYWKNVTGGTIPSGAGQVILANSTDVVVENQTLTKTSTGILTHVSSNIMIIGNNVSSNKLGGMDLGRFSYGSISNNTVISNARFGIDCFSHCRNNTIANNLVSNNSDGIFIGYTDCRNNVITNNTILNNKDTGMFIPSGNNKIYHNNFIDNARQAYDWDEINQWDNGYPSGGNYWSNYAGVDEKSGPGQNQTGHDHIGDTPHRVDSNSWDRYPLMIPSGLLPPSPPVMLDAVLSGKDLENVTLTWALSPDDRAGQDVVVEYRIYRNETYDPNGLGYELIASLLNGTSQFIDNLAGEGNPDNYFYIVCAIDEYNRSSCTENQAGKFTRPLVEGPNLVSIPLIQSDETITTVLQTVSLDKAWLYDSLEQEWRTFMKSKPYLGDLGYLDHAIGFWLNVTEDSNLTVAGIVPLRTVIQFHAGWNLVGFPSFNSTYTIADLKAETGATRVEGFDTSSSPYFLKLLQNGDTLQAEYGYWVKAGSDISWTVGNS
jgi:parallel beta-helix repeat protein